MGSFHVPRPTYGAYDFFLPVLLWPELSHPTTPNSDEAAKCHLIVSFMEEEMGLVLS